jgi:CBS domain-containing protein
MTPYVVSVLPDQSVFDAAKLMLEKKISGLPVVDDTGNLVGIVTEVTFCAALKSARSVSGREGSSSLWAPAALPTSMFGLVAAPRC